MRTTIQASLNITTNVPYNDKAVKCAHRWHVLIADGLTICQAARQGGQHGRYGRLSMERSFV